MEKPSLEIVEAKIEFADENVGMEDPLTKENTIDTSANSNSSIMQVCSLMSEGATGSMCADEMTIEEIKLEPSDEFDPSWQPPSEKRSKDVPDKVVESDQSVSTISGSATHNEQRYRRLRCNNCYLLFYSEKILTKHQMKCQQVLEKVNSAGTEPANKIKISTIEDLRKRLPHFTVGIIKGDGVDRRKGPRDVTSTAQPHNRIPVCTTPSTKNVVSFSRQAAQSSPLIATTNLDPLSVDTVPIPPSPNAVPSGSNPSVSVPFYYPSPVLCPPPSVQPDVTAKLAEQLNRIENEMAKLRKENCRLRESLDLSIDLPTVKKSNGLNVFEYEMLDTREQLEELEEKLGKDAAFSDAMVVWLKKETEDCNPETSIARSIDSLFSRQLFVNCSWTGVGKTAPKIPFCQLKNVLTLLRRTAGTLGRQAPASLVENVVRRRLREAQQRLCGQPGRKAYCHQKKRSRKSTNYGSTEDSSN